MECLVLRHEDPSSDPQHLYEKLDLCCMHAISVLGKMEKEDPRDLLASQSRSVCQPPAQWETNIKKK